MHVIARRAGAQWNVHPKDTYAMYTDADFIEARTKEYIRNSIFLADSFASLSADLGPGSLALYLGTEPRFEKDTVWYEPCIGDLESMPPLRFDPENRWWKQHFDLIKTLRARSNGEYIFNMPDLIENMDIYSAMRGPENALFDMMDDPERVEERIAQIDDSYFTYYDALLDVVQDNGVCSYTAFNILGKGRVAKIQCDFSAMISPAQYRRFVLPSLKKQAKRLEHTLYHLDGPDAIRHVPAIMEIEELNALQWTCGAGQPDGACPRWYTIYDQVIAAGKGLWIQLYDGGVQDWIHGAESLMERYGKKPFYFNFPDMSERDAETLLTRADTYWR